MADKRMDPAVLDHLEWLGFVQPTGLVVSAAALSRVGLLLTTPVVLTATVFSQTGAVERTLPPVALEAGERLLPLDLSALRSGTHLLRITDGVTTVHAGIHVIR